MLHVTGDKVKVRIAKDAYGYEANGNGQEHGVVIEVPSEEDILYLGFHSFGFDNSITNQEIIKKVYGYYKQFEGKIVYWEALQDRGRRFQDGDEEVVILNMTDIIGYDDEDHATAYLVDDVRSGGFKV